ncbi:MAG: hypothetical protein V3W41_21895 [Planctomycetota bacterium]
MRAIRAAVVGVEGDVRITRVGSPTCIEVRVDFDGVDTEAIEFLKKSEASGWTLRMRLELIDPKGAK